MQHVCQKLVAGRPGKFLVRCGKRVPPQYAEAHREFHQNGGSPSSSIGRASRKARMKLFVVKVPVAVVTLNDAVGKLYTEAETPAVELKAVRQRSTPVPTHKVADKQPGLLRRMAQLLGLR